MKKKIKVIVCRVGRRPVVEHVEPGLAAMQAIVGGLVEVVGLDDGVDLYCNEEGALVDLPLNRVIPTVGRATPPGFEGALVIDMTDGGRALPGEPAEWRIRGDFFMARATEDGELADVTDADVARYEAMFDSEDTERRAP